MANPQEAKTVSGKKVVVMSLILFTLFTAVMMAGTFQCAKVLTPILRARNANMAPPTK